jgi:hypothetical protein
MNLENGIPVPRDTEYGDKEVKKSNLILEAGILKAKGCLEEAAIKFAEAGGLEEELQCFCQQNGFEKKSFVHAFSAVYCWIHAGDTHHALVLCKNIFKQKGLTEPLKQKAEQLLNDLHKMRKQYWDDFHEKMQHLEEAQGLTEKVAA